MSLQSASLDRRNFLRAALAGAVAIPLGVTLASCSTGGGGGATGQKSAKNPFGMADNTTVDAVIFNGGYKTDYVDFAGKILAKEHSGSSVKVKPETKIATTLQPRFVGGNPPDLIDNSGADAIGFNSILDQLEELQDVLDANNLEGTKISDTLYPGVLTPGEFDGKLKALNYVLTLYAVWYSASLFEKNGWTPPTTWDEAFELGGKAKAAGKYLFVWGKEAATYYQTLVIDSAIKEGGDEVRLNFDNLKDGAWSQDSVQKVLTSLKKIIDAGYVKPGGSGTQFTAAQAQWSNDQSGLLYPSGSWIENEMKSQTAADFQMTGTPEFTVTTGSKLPQTALRSTAGEPFAVPSAAKSVAGGKEVLRIMLSKESATNFAKTRLAPSIVKDTVPDDAFGSTALASQISMLNAAKTDTFTFTFVDNYGTNTDQLVLWNAFLDGKSSVNELTDGLQQISDKIAKDDSIKKITVK
ncbi:N-acetylglucosamine/diacetylchitobiose ABC transporter substrate-binding protein [Schumannella luteola]|uniref:N-acetylglucosamine transport system substrate-binding protein n=1 Tax=Schumannella luteola TaxID=472059 RepID=A0A852YQJ5_9MICO|nr:N-acetylglucosamine/diacetylchitobiose ABC transporter substrate-binding protein [Schumannella luteola]NYG99495.1 N-acetylglucosamine transport system substrate-binding protein [Schumannella luteola]TPX03821.1 carbohydrate ABC transporter, N-acetylglucosamine/diacetylchitobiose-binding protein [Schumannella luteola]